ncbi:MAG: hypothetical protein A3F72_05715 [Bacteroidetes bacterium RIFCSPLOWO2_12_FULL_35_15]|nr:MAG: hypothetical protein A3F72_05715 [Bacteroidetes bacterium RIFCSPLOWO2_12_FULL_35_15]
MLARTTENIKDGTKTQIIHTTPTAQIRENLKASTINKKVKKLYLMCLKILKNKQNGKRT